MGVLRKAVDVCRVPTWFILGTGQGAQGADAETISSILRDIKFLLTCQDIQKRPELKKLFSHSMFRVLSDDELGRLSRVIEPLLHECCTVR